MCLYNSHVDQYYMLINILIFRSKYCFLKIFFVCKNLVYSNYNLHNCNLHLLLYKKCENGKIHSKHLNATNIYIPITKQSFNIEFIGNHFDVSKYFTPTQIITIDNVTTCLAILTHLQTLPNNTNAQ